MDKLVCDICGGKLIMQAGGVSKCDSCGVEYSLERMREKVQEMKIVGSVEITKGEAELERELAAVKEFTELGYYQRAMEKGIKLIDEFPHDYRCWWETAYAMANNYFSNNDVHFPSMESNYITALKIAAKLPDTKVAIALTQQWDVLWQKKLSDVASGDDAVAFRGMVFIKNYNTPIGKSRLDDIKRIYPFLTAVIDKGFANAKALNTAGIGVVNFHGNQWAHASDRTSGFSFVYGDLVLSSYWYQVNGSVYEYANTITHVTQNTINDIHKIIAAREKTVLKDDVCPHCNGNSLNWLKSKCKKCTWERKW